MRSIGLQIEGKGVLPGDPYHCGGVGGVGTRNTIHIYIYLWTMICVYDENIYICSVIQYVKEL